MSQITIWCIIAAVSMTGSFIQRVTGFGYGIFTMIFFPSFLASYGEANILTGMVSLISTFAVVIPLFKHVDWKSIVAPVIGCMISSYLAVKFMQGQSDGMLKLLLGIILILLSIYFFLFSSKIHFNPSIPAGLIVGLLSGIMNGLFSMGGPPVVVYFLGISKDDPKKYVATIQAYFLVTNIYSFAVKAGAGYLTMDVWKIFPFAVAGMAIGVFIGKRVFDKLNAGILKKCVYAFMAVSGIVNIASTIANGL